MINYHLIRALNSPWFIQPEAAEFHSLILHKLLTQETSLTTLNEDKPVKEFAFAVDAAGKRIGTVKDAANAGVAVINMQGAIMKYDYCGAAGTLTMQQALQQANENPSIKAIVLQIDSPGGSVDGTQQFANAVKNSSKPVVAYINGMMCSAAMWIGSAASKLIASSNTDTIGSIGTMASWTDFNEYYKKIGLTKHEVYATDSTQKNIQFREANNKANYEPMIKTWLDPLNKEFTSAIMQNLPNADKTVLNGSHYIATEAKKKGLIDSIGSFQVAVKTALSLVSANTSNNINNTTTTMQPKAQAAQSNKAKANEMPFQKDLNDVVNGTSSEENQDKYKTSFDEKYGQQRKSKVSAMDLQKGLNDLI
jgi:protease IV